MKDRDLVDAGWEDVLAWLPSNLDEIAKETGGFLRRRVFRRASDVLRLTLAYAVNDLSLRGASGWAARQKIAKVSDVAVLKRLRRMVPFLAWLLAWVLGRSLERPSSVDLPLRVRLVDATALSVPGSTGTDWRVHASYDVARRRFDCIEVTDVSGGEHLGRYKPGPGDLVVGDRGNAHAKRIGEAREAGAHVLVRVGHQSVPLVDDSGERVDVLGFATRRRSGPGRPPRVEERGANVRAPNGRLWPVRLIVVRKSRQEAEKERRRIRKEAKRRGRTPTKRTLRAAAFIFILSSVPIEMVAPEVLAELYQVRWQVELAFKRLKSLAHLDALRAQDPDLARTYILGNLLAASLVQLIAQGTRAFSPWGVPLQSTAVEPMAA